MFVKQANSTLEFFYKKKNTHSPNPRVNSSFNFVDLCEYPIDTCFLQVVETSNSQCY